MDENILKNPEFEKRLESALVRISNYFSETNYTLENLKLKELIQWHDDRFNRQRVVYPHTDCPKEIRNTVDRIINEEFKPI